jgi:hypothetical protein
MVVLSVIELTSNRCVAHAISPRRVLRSVVIDGSHLSIEDAMSTAGREICKGKGRSIVGAFSLGPMGAAKTE